MQVDRGPESESSKSSSEGEEMQTTKEQAEFLSKLLEAAPMMAVLSRKARALAPLIIEKELDQIFDLAGFSRWSAATRLLGRLLRARRC